MFQNDNEEDQVVDLEEGDVLTNKDKTNFPLDHNEFEVFVNGRTGTKRSRASAWLKDDGSIEVHDSANPDFWLRFKLPVFYITSQSRRIEKDPETQKRRKLYEELKREFE